jgi:hypothetical protein
VIRLPSPNPHLQVLRILPSSNHVSPTRRDVGVVRLDLGGGPGKNVRYENLPRVFSSLFGYGSDW